MKKNLYYFFTQYLSPNFKFPKREHYSILDPVMNQKLFKYFYIEKSNSINDIPDHIKPYILKKYGLLNENQKEPLKRIEVKAKGYCVRSRVRIPVVVKNISMEGFCIHTNIPFIQPGETVDFNFQLGVGLNINVSGIAVWVDQVNSYGFQVDESHKNIWAQKLIPSFFSPVLCNLKNDQISDLLLKFFKILS